MANWRDRRAAVRIIEGWGVAFPDICVRVFELAHDSDQSLAAFARWAAKAEATVFSDTRSAAAWVVLYDSPARATLLDLSPPEFLSSTAEVAPSFEAIRESFRRLIEAGSPEARELLARRLALGVSMAALIGTMPVRAAVEALANLDRAIVEANRAQSGPAIGYPLQFQLPEGLDDLRRRIRDLHTETLTGIQVDLGDRARVGAALGSHSAAGLRLVDGLSDPDAAYGALCQNEDALHRLTTVLETAPGLLEALRKSQSLTHCLLESGFEAPEFLKDLDLATSPASLAAQFLLELSHTTLAWAIEPSFSLGEALTAAHDALLRHICGRLCLSLDLVALGSYGSREMSLVSDLDLLVLSRDEDPGAKDQLASLLAFVAGLSRHGVEVRLDVGLESETARVRPSTPMIWTYQGFGDYELEKMGLVERFNLGNARQVWGDSEAERIVRKGAYALPLTPERLRDLVALKKQAESAISARYRRRNVKQGFGGLTDIEWFIHLHEMRFPTATRAGSTIELDERVASLAATRLINSVEREELLEARRHLREVRHRLSLLGFAEDVIPENPDKLARLGAVFGYADGNDFLAYHERVIDTVRGIYLEGLERLKA